MFLRFYMSRIKRLMYQVRHSFFLFGLLSILWFIFRTGTKPTRMSSPCQRASAATGGLWLTSYGLPFFLAIHSPNMPSLKSNSMILAGLLLALVPLLFVSTNMFNIIGDAQVASAAHGADVKLTFSDKQAKSSVASDIFVVNGTDGNNKGAKELIGLMESHGLSFYAENNSFSIIGQE